MTDFEDQKIKQAYQDLIRSEISRAEIQEEKKAFLEAHFRQEPVFWVRPGFFVPALAMAAILLAFVFFQKPVEMERTKPYTKHAMFVTQGRNGKQTATVEVKRLSSTVGPTMVYQKTNQDTSVTVVWVFKPGLH